MDSRLLKALWLWTCVGGGGGLPLSGEAGGGMLHIISSRTNCPQCVSMDKVWRCCNLDGVDTWTLKTEATATSGVLRRDYAVH
jgi:hypothetical protein